MRSDDDKKKISREQVIQSLVDLIPQYLEGRVSTAINARKANRDMPRETPIFLNDFLEYCLRKTPTNFPDELREDRKENWQRILYDTYQITADDLLDPMMEWLKKSKFHRAGCPSYEGICKSVSKKFPEKNRVFFKLI